MKKIFTLLLSCLTLGAFAATEQAWYNDVTSIANNGQYYIYSVSGKGFMQGGNSKVKAITQNNYNSESNLLFTISTSNKRTYSGSNYLCSYETQTCGPVGGTNTSGSTMIWEGKSGYWLVYGSYSFIWTQKAYLRYENNAYNATCLNPDLSDSKFHWYLVSPAQYDRHWAIYFYDRYKESISDYTKWENLVPAAYYTALADAYAVTYSVKNTAHSKEVVNAHRAELTNLYNNAEEVADACANAKEAINALEAVEDKGEDFVDVTADINNARTAIEQAMSVDALNAVVAGLKAIDPITFSVTEFTAISSVEGAAASQAGRAITYEAVDKSIINNGKALYKGTTTLTATAAATSEYYKFVRSAQVTVDAPTTYGDFEETSCDEPVEYNGKTYSETTKEDMNVGLNYMGGDSVVHVAITINHATFGTDEMTIVYGDEVEWNGIALKDSTVGVHSVVAVLTNAAGCDSTVTLTLTVNKQETLEVPVDLAFCAGGSEWYRGVEYTEAGVYDVPAEGATRDTLYKVNVVVLQPTFGTDEKTIVYGAEEEWNGIALKDSTVGVHYVEFVTTNAAGCDSTVTLTLTVNKIETLEVPVDLSFCAGGSDWYRGVEYTEAGVYDIPAEGATRDTLYKVNVVVLQPTFGTDEKTIVYGAEEEWNGIALKDSTVGVHNVVAVLTNAAGCDSTVTLTLTVNKLEMLETEYQIEICEGSEQEYRGVIYNEEGRFTLDVIEGETRDTLLTVVVTVNAKGYEEILLTDTIGNTIELPEGEWILGDDVVSGSYDVQETDIEGLVFVQIGETEKGCEAVTKIIVTVEEKPQDQGDPTGFETIEGAQKAVKEFRNGVLYIRRGEKVYTASGELVK